MVDTKPLLKGFGAAADVAGQIATDKAVNSRRTRSNFSQVDITQGQLIEDAVLITDTTGNSNKIPHQLNRVPHGAIIVEMSANASGNTHCRSTTENYVRIASSLPGTATIWVF
jgi:hypothetical protein